jgi:hypothetical protein
MATEEIRTILDFIGCQYAKVMAKRAFFSEKQKEPSVYNERVMKRMFRDVDSGAKLWEEMSRSCWQIAQPEKKCAYCGAKKNLRKTRIIPESIAIKPECQTCDRMQAANNTLWACGQCNAKKGNKGLYEFYKELFPQKDRFFDAIPTAVEGKYLKTIHHCHRCAGTLDLEDIDGDGELTALDVDFVLRRKTGNFISD